MAEIVLYAFMMISVNFNDMAFSFPTMLECQEQRGELIKILEEKSEGLNEATYISPCEQVGLTVRKNPKYK